MYEMTGTVLKVFDVMTFDSGFQKREFVVELPDGRFPQPIKFTTIKEKMSILDGVGEGDTVTVSFDLRGREWQEKYFVDLQAWRLSKGSGGSAEQPHPPSGGTQELSAGDPAHQFEPAHGDDDGEEGLPF